MANHKSALKRARQNPKKRLRNMHFKSTAKTVADKVLASIEANDVEGAKKLLIEASSVLDKVASKGIIHKNKAARKKSRLSLKVKMLTASSSSSSQPASS